MKEFMNFLFGDEKRSTLLLLALVCDYLMFVFYV